jgi:hypothetical protein
VLRGGTAVGGLTGYDEFNVQSYSVFVREPTADSPDTGFGGGVYVVYEPDTRHGDPGIHDTLQWIQVAATFGVGRCGRCSVGKPVASGSL